MMRSASRQRGMTLIGWMAVLAVGAFFLMIFFRLFPVYMENFAVQSSLESLQSDAEVGSKSGLLHSKAEVWDTLEKRLQINDVDRVKPKNVTIERKSGKFEVRVAYEVRVPFMYNIDFVVKFDEMAEVPAS